jgi:hypothetical protein
MNCRWIVIGTLLLAGCSMPGQGAKEIDYSRLSYHSAQASPIPALCLEDMQGC